MKAAEFDYVRPQTVAEVCAVLAREDEAKIIAGGQTLVPLMAMRLARPALLVDINDITELQGISDEGDHIAIKSCTRQAAAERSDIVQTRLPLLAKGLRWVGHQQTRNRGTVGGSIAHGDPSAEIPLAALTLDATLVAQNQNETAEIAMDGFFEAAMMTGLSPDQIITEVRFPVWSGPARMGTGFQEVSSRESDFAVVAAAAQIQLAQDGTFSRAAVSVGGVAPAPVRLRALEDALTGKSIDDDSLASALRLIDPAIDPDSDLHGTADYRRRVARILVERAIREAAGEAGA